MQLCEIALNPAANGFKCLDESQTRETAGRHPDARTPELRPAGCCSTNPHPPLQLHPPEMNHLDFKKD